MMVPLCVCLYVYIIYFKCCCRRNSDTQRKHCHHAAAVMLLLCCCPGCCCTAVASSAEEVPSRDDGPLARLMAIVGVQNVTSVTTNGVSPQNVSDDVGNTGNGMLHLWQKYGFFHTHNITSCSFYLLLCW